jgi:hypothetical protein
VHIRVGHELVYECRTTDTMIVTLHVHYRRASDMVRPDHLLLSPSGPVAGYRDSFGNRCPRIVAPAGRYGSPATP